MLPTLTKPTKFKRDHLLRALLFHADSFKHSGRANLNLLSALLQQHAPAGQLVLDPMGGTGSILIATDQQHPVISGELESHWALVSEMNRKSIAGQRLFSASTPALCCQWDTGCLPLASGSVPFLITSPPYWDMLSDWHIKSKGLQVAHDIYGPAYGTSPRNLGNVHVYEDYLRAMAAVYHECWRVLRPGAKLILIVKDRVHKFRRVPLVRDTIGLAAALGFALIEQVDRQVIPSLHRRVNQLHYPHAETVDTEQALVFQKQNRRASGGQKFALVQAPKPKSAPSWQLFVKQWNYALSRADKILPMSHNGLEDDLFVADSPNHSSFRRRKEFSFDCASDIVTKFGFGAGDEIELHCSMAYGQYLRERLLTFGGKVSIPTEGLNLGQKLKWYTERDQARSQEGQL